MTGTVTGHGKLPDDDIISTGALAWLDRRGHWVRSSSVFAVGESAGREIPLEGIDT